MFGAFKCCGVGARVLRNGTPPIGHGMSLDSLSAGEVNAAVLLGCGNINWSQRRFLRGNGSSIAGSRNNINAQFVIKEIEGQISGQVGRDRNRLSDVDNDNTAVCKEKELRKYSRSLRGHQSMLLTSLPNLKENMGHDTLLSEVSKIVVDDTPANLRIKSRKEEALLKEWISVQRELRTIKRERLVDYRRKLQIAGQQVLKEMETNLKKGMNLDDLDQAIEGAL